jgi:hypothetical protein
MKMLKELCRSEAGLVLIEMSVTVTLISLIMAGLLAVYFLVGSSFEKITTEAEMQYALRDAANLLKQDIYCSEKAEILDSVNGKEVDNGEQGTCLRLLINQKNHLLNNYIGIGYYVENRTLYRHRYYLHDLGNPLDDEFMDKIPIADNMNHLSFSSPVTGLIDYQLSIGNSKLIRWWSGCCQSRVSYGLNEI